MAEKKHNRIERLKRRLYRRENPEGRDYKRSSISGDDYDVRDTWRPSASGNGAAAPSASTSQSSSRGGLLGKLLVAGIVFFVLAAVFAAWQIFSGMNVVSSKNVDLQIDGPVSVNAGDELTLDVTMRNNNEVAIESATLIVSYPTGTRAAEDIQAELPRQREQIGRIEPGETITRSLSSVVFGEKDSVKEIVATLEYRVENSNATFDKKANYSVTISSAPLIMEIQRPNEVNAGQEFEFVATLTSNAKEVIEDVLLVAEYPFGFSYDEASPEPAFEKNVWQIGDIPPGEEEVITIRGTMRGQENEERTFRFSAGTSDSSRPQDIAVPYINSKETLTIKKPFVGLTVSVDDDTGPSPVKQMGQDMQVDIQWKSNLEHDLSDARLTAELEGRALDRSAISVGSGGFYRSVDDTVVWEAANHEQLRQIKPGDDGIVTFSLATKQTSPSLVSSLSNPQVDLRVTLEGDRLLEGQSRSERITVEESRTIKVQSDLDLGSRIVHTVGPFDNSGPIPPEAETPTTYTVMWSITNTYNDVSDATVRASLPSYVEWADTVSPTGGNVTFNEQTREVIWRPGPIDAGTGFTSSPKRVAFQVRFLPSVGQIDTQPTIVTPAELQGEDTFTKKVIRDRTSSLTTNLSTDPNTTPGDSRVRAAGE